MNDFQDELESLINRHSQESGSDTPDFILASYLNDCLKSYNAAVQARDQWYGRPRTVPCTTPDCSNRTATRAPIDAVECGECAAKNSHSIDGLRSTTTLEAAANSVPEDSEGEGNDS